MEIRVARSSHTQAELLVSSLRFLNTMTSKQRKDLVKFAKQLTAEGKHQAAQSVLDLLNEGRWILFNQSL